MLKKVSSIIIALVVQMAFSFSEEDAARIARAFCCTNTPLEINTRLYPLYTNIWYNLNRNDSAYARSIHYAILTNAMSFKVGDLAYWRRWGMSERVSMFLDIYTFKPSVTDGLYVEHCAEYIGTRMIPVAGGGAENARIVREYNEDLEYSRLHMIEGFRRLVQAYEAKLDDSNIPVFRTNIIDRARLTEDERRILWPEAK